MAKKLLTYVLIFTLLAFPLQIFAAVPSKLKVALNSKALNTSITQLADGTRYLSIKDLLSPLGYQISYDQKAQALTAVLNSSRLVFPADQSYVIKNGIKKAIPHPIKSFNGQICLSTNSLTTALNATCTPNPATSTLEIDLFSKFIDTDLADLPQLTMPDFQLAAYKKVMSGKINYAIDERLFTLMALANYCGFNHENCTGYNATRQGVVDALKSKNLKFTVSNEELLTHLKRVTAPSLTRFVGSAPHFEAIDKEDPISQELSAALKEFYAAADIHELFLKNKKDYQASIDDWQSTDLLEAICKTLYFLKIKPEDAPAMTILPNLLDMKLSGSGLVFDPAYDTNTILMGYGKGSAAKVIILHEYLHGIVGPILKKYSSEVEALNCYDQVSGNKIMQTYYSNWESVVNESLVRSLDFLAFSFPRAYQIGQQKQQGFILIDYFFNSFADYPKSSADLDTYIHQLLLNYKA